jgi:signal transduction histidine kinase
VKKHHRSFRILKVRIPRRHSSLEPRRGLARRAPVPVELDLRAGRRLPGAVEVAAYYAVSEAVANAAKHARASAVQVELDADEAMVRLAVRDDGDGGADPARGSWLTGLGDRVEALGGTLHITRPPGAGTTLLIQIPATRHHTPGPPEP